MKNEIKTYEEAVRYLNEIFQLINKDFFNDELPTPTITIQQKKGTYGHFSTDPCTWKSSDGGSHEINIAAAHLTRPIANVVATLIHECVHYWCFIKGIKDTSNRGIYHNSKFRDIAYMKGLLISQHPIYGWTITSPDKPVFDFCAKYELTDILINRPDSDLMATKKKKTKSNSHKMICPHCGDIVRSTRLGLQIECIICQEQFLYVD